MARLIHLTAWFLLGCIFSSLTAWLGKIHPALFKITVLIYGLIAIFIALAVLLDDAVIDFFKVPNDYYYGVIIAILVAIIFGLAVTVL